MWTVRGNILDIDLDGDKLTYTNEIEHTIKLKPNCRPIYKRL